MKISTFLFLFLAISAHFWLGCLHYTQNFQKSGMHMIDCLHNLAYGRSVTNSPMWSESSKEKHRQKMVKECCPAGGEISFFLNSKPGKWKQLAQCSLHGRPAAPDYSHLSAFHQRKVVAWRSGEEFIETHPAAELLWKLFLAGLISSIYILTILYQKGFFGKPGEGFAESDLPEPDKKTAHSFLNKQKWSLMASLALLLPYSFYLRAGLGFLPTNLLFFIVFSIFARTSFYFRSISHGS